MDTTKLSTLLEEAKSSGITLGKIPQDIHPSLKETYLVDYINVKKEIEDKLLETIKEIPELSIFDGKLFNCGSYSQRVELGRFIKSLLYRTHRYGVKKTSDDLNKYIELDGNPLCEIQLVSGIEVEEEIDLTDDTKLVPFDKIPDCWQKDNFSPSSYKFPYDKYCSKAAILRKTNASPKSYHQDKRPRKLIEVDIQLSDICDILTLIGPSSPYLTTYWTILDEIIPLKLEAGIMGDFGLPSHYNIYSYNSEDYVFAKDIVRSYLSLNNDLKKNLLLSVKRLNAAQRRNSMEDKAIDLGMALEILLLHDYNQNDPISLPFRLRGAWFLGEEMGGRKHTYDLLKSIYNCRSSAVHSGKLKKNKYKIDGQDTQSAKLFEEGFKLCSELIIKIIKEKKFPDWEKLILKL